MRVSPCAGGSDVVNLVVYGSLMKKGERDQAGLAPRDALPIAIDGYARFFDQIPSWRRGQGRSVAALAARRDQECRMNAVLLLDVAGDLASTDHRERGYDRRRVAAEAMARHGDGEPVRVSGDTYVYVGKLALRGREILPNREYLRLCLDGAREWGAAFYEDFLRTTLLCDGRTLEAYVDLPGLIGAARS